MAVSGVRRSWKMLVTFGYRRGTQMPGKGRRVDTSDFLKDILEFHTQDVHSWLITCNKQKERNERE